MVAYHGYQSFAEGEVTPEMAHEIGVKLAKEVWGERHEVLVATHLDKAHHLHNHFVVNSISFVDGKRYRRTAKDYYQMKTESDRLCREYSLPVIEPKGKGRDFSEWQADKNGGMTWRSIVQRDVDLAIAAAMTDNQFFDELKRMGYSYKVGKDISVRPPGKERYVRLVHNFGEEYSFDNIIFQIRSQARPYYPPEPPVHRAYYRTHSNPHSSKKLTGLQAQYYYYLYRLGYAYIQTLAVLLLCIPCFALFPLGSIVVILFAVKVYVKNAGKADELLAQRKKQITAELPRFAATIATELGNSRDVLSILDNYKQNAAEPLKSELFQTVSDMRSGSYEQALSRFEIRVDLAELSEIVRGLLAVIGGNDGRMHFQMLARNLRTVEISKLKEQAKALAPKIRRCSQVLLVCFIATFLVVMGMEIFGTLTTMFV